MRPSALRTRLRSVADGLKHPSAFVRGSVTVAAGTGLAQVIVLIATPFLTRLYSPADHGVLSMATSLLFVLISIGCLRYDFALPLPERDVDAANLLAVALLANAVSSAIVAVILIGAGPALIPPLGLAPLGGLIALLAVAQFAGGATSALVHWALRARDYTSVATNRVTQNAVLVGGQLAFGFVRAGAPGLFLGAVAGSCAGMLRLVATTWRRDRDALRRISPAGMAAAAQRYRRFPLVSSWSALLAALGVRAPLVLLILIHGTATGGQYALAERVLYLPLTLVAGSVGQVFVAEAAQATRTGAGGLVALYRRTTLTLARIAIVPAIAVAVVAPILTVPVFGAAWTEAGLYIAVLVPMFFMTFVATATGNVLNVVERQGLQLLRELVRLGLLGGAVLGAGLAGLDPLGTVVTISAAGCLTYAVYLLVSWHAVRTFESGGPGAGSGPRGTPASGVGNP